MKVPVCMLFLVLVSLFTASLVVAQEAEAPCQGILFPSSTAELLAHRDSYTAVLAECPVEIPGGFALGDVDIRITLLMNGGAEEVVTLTLENGDVVGVSNQESKASYFIEMRECELDAILSAPSRRGAVADLYLDEVFDITAKGFFSRSKLFLAKPILNMALKRMRVETELLC